MKYVFPNCVAVVSWQGGRMHLRPDQQWDADDPFVRARPEFFNEDPQRVSGTVDPAAERVTRAPGEKRAAVTRKKVAKNEPKDQ